MSSNFVDLTNDATSLPIGQTTSVFYVLRQNHFFHVACRIVLIVNNTEVMKASHAVGLRIVFQLVQCYNKTARNVAAACAFLCV